MENPAPEGIKYCVHLKHEYHTVESPAPEGIKYCVHLKHENHTVENPAPEGIKYCGSHRNKLATRTSAILLTFFFSASNEVHDVL